MTDLLKPEEITKAGKYIPTKEEWAIRPDHRYWQDQRIAKAQLAKCQGVCPECNPNQESEGVPSGGKIYDQDRGVWVDCPACQGTGKRSTPDREKIAFKLYCKSFIGNEKGWLNEAPEVREFWGRCADQIQALIDKEKEASNG